MKYFYSPEKDSVFPEDFKEEYIQANSWPDDAVEITEDEFKSFFLNSSPIGMKRKYSTNGFNWVEIPQKLEDAINSERLWRNSELQRADVELNKVQDSDPKAKGSVSAWREYRKALRALPEHHEFPYKQARPLAPDSL